MQQFDSHDSLSWLLKKVLNKFDEITTCIESWQQNESIRANIFDGDCRATRSACLAITVNARALNSALIALITDKDMKHQYVTKTGIGLPNGEQLDNTNHHGEANFSRLEQQFRLTLEVVGTVRSRVRDFIDENFGPLLLTRALEAQARNDLQYHVGFHLAHLEDAFLMLQAVLVHGLDRRCTDILVWVQRIEELISRIKSNFLVPMDEAAA